MLSFLRILASIDYLDQLKLKYEKKKALVQALVQPLFGLNILYCILYLFFYLFIYFIILRYLEGFL